MKQNRLILLSIFLFGLLLISSCSETIKVELPTSALIHYSVADKQVAFTALAHNADTYSWDFGDGETSSEPNPVHVYANGGYYTVTLTVAGGTGTAVDSDDLAIALTPYVLLTGGATAENGKTWRLSGNHSQYDYFANADADLTTYLPDYTPLPAGIFGAGLGMGEVYEDEFTFYFDGRYSHDVMADGAAFGGIVYQFLLDGGASIVNANGQDFGLCTAKYTPESGATFTYVENEDFTVPSVYGPGGALTYKGVSTLDFSGTEFVGFRDFQRKVIIQEVADKSMRLVMFVSASPDYAPLNTHALVLTFETVD